MKTEIESLASFAGPVNVRGYVWRNGEWLEFAGQDDIIWVDDGDGGVAREFFARTREEYYLQPVS